MLPYTCLYKRNIKIFSYSIRNRSFKAAYHPSFQIQVSHLETKVHIALMKNFEKTFSTVDSSLVSGIMINVLIALAFGASMRRMWGLLNTLQILTHITLLAVKIPENLNTCLKIILQISSLSIIP